MTSIEEALTALHDEAQETQSMIVGAEDARAIALVLLNMYTINTASMLMLAGGIEAFGDERLKEFSNSVGEYNNGAIEDVNQRVDTFAFLCDVPAAADFLEEFEDVDFSDGDNG